jgi:hypothetical protein
MNHLRVKPQQEKSQQTPSLMKDTTYRVAVNGQPSEPFDMETLSRMIIAGFILKDSLVWTNGMSSWKRAGEVDELKGMFTETTAKQEANAVNEDIPSIPTK